MNEAKSIQLATWSAESGEMVPRSNRPVLLLTAAVDARNGKGCLFSPQLRLRQYLRAFKFYVGFLKSNPESCKGVVFCENSGADLLPFRRLVPDGLEGSVEFVSLDKEGFRPEMGKSWNEMRSIDLTLEAAGSIADGDLIVKLTGRYPIHNIRRLVSDLIRQPVEVRVGCFRWPAGGWLSRHPALVDTRCFAFRKSVWNETFKGLYERAGGRNFELVAESVFRKHENEPGWICPFSRPPLIVGLQGGTKRVAGFRIPKPVEPVFLFMTYLVHWGQLLRSRRHAPS